MALEEGSVKESGMWQEQSGSLILIVGSQEKLEFCFADKNRETKYS